MLNDGLVASRLDGVVPEEVHAVLANRDQVEANWRGRKPVRDTIPLEGGKASGWRAPIQSGSDRSVITRPQSDTGGAEARVK